MRCSSKRWFAAVLLATLLALGCVACGPEDGRARGGGPGADVGNKPAQVKPQSKLFNGQ